MSVLVPTNIARMKKIGRIIISVTGYRYNPGIKSVMEDIGNDPDKVRDFVIYMAVSLANELKRAIDTQRYKSSKWPPLSVSYTSYKKRHRLKLRIWEATGYLKHHIHIFRQGSNLVVGFQEKDVYPRSRVRLNLIAKYIEYGTNKIPARPLFRPILLQVRKHIAQYFKRYLRDLSLYKKEYLFIDEDKSKSARLFASTTEISKKMQREYIKGRIRKPKRKPKNGIDKSLFDSQI